QRVVTRVKQGSAEKRITENDSIIVQSNKRLLRLEHVPPMKAQIEGEADGKEYEDAQVQERRKNEAQAGQVSGAGTSGAGASGGRQRPVGGALRRSGDGARAFG